MLKPLLLLCWTAIFVSAGDQKINGTSDTSVPISSPQDRITSVQPQLPLHPKQTVDSSELVPSIQVTNSPKLLDLDTKSAEEYTPEFTSESYVKISPTTTKPTTTTTPSTTTMTTTSTTTTTTVPTTSTTPAPTPVPPPSKKRWVLRQNNTTCIIAQMAAQFNFSYTVNNKTVQKVMDIPSQGNGTVSGVCGNIEQNLTVSWNASQKNMDNFTLHFKKNETTEHYSLHHFEISLAPEEFPADNWNKTVTLVHMLPQYEVALSHSYRCLREQKLNLYMQGGNKTVGHLTITELQFQAFRGENNTIFGLAKDCAFETPDIVPITVGCALAGLVVIVLIAYLVGRRRSQARGYLSM